ncbi:MAG: insulinase family protein [Anaerolineaceae bacterium]|nr:insulinase family protein [Anaerolineaceae bacterium]
MTNKVPFTPQKTAMPSPDDITREVLPNGITILARSNFNSPTLSIRGYLPSGSIYDPDDKLGLSYLTANSLMSGTVHYDFQALYNEIESVGAKIGFSSGTLTSAFSAHSLSEDLDLIMGLMAECLRRPTFPKREFNRLKMQMLTGLAIRSQDTAAMASMLFDEAVFAGHPYERPDDGYIETVQAIEREDLASFYKRTFGPKGLTIAIVGAVAPQTAVDSIKAALGDWSNPDQESLPELPPLAPITQPIRKNLTINGKSQADIVIGCQAPERLSSDYVPLRIGNNILGEFGMMGRLGKSVREDSGLAYYVYSNLSSSLGPGAWEMIAGVNPRSVEQAIELMSAEARRFVSEPVTAEELDDSKSLFLGRLPLMLESNNGVAISLLNMERFDLGLDYFIQYPGRIKAVTAEQIFESSRKYLNPDNLIVTVAGP